MQATIRQSAKAANAAAFLVGANYQPRPLDALIAAPVVIAGTGVERHVTRAEVQAAPDCFNKDASLRKATHLTGHPGLDQ
jgi:hypothetical protein